MAKRFGDVLGKDSVGWDAIRREGLRRLMKTNGDALNPGMSLKAFDKAMKEHGTLMRELYTKEELSKVGRFLTHVKRTQPDIIRSRENPSGTAQKAKKTIEQMIPGLAGVMGDPATGFALHVGARGVINFRNVKGATEATRPFSMPKGINSGS